MPEIHLETNVGRNLAALVEANGLRAVVEKLATIAYAMADHVEDRAVSRLWLAAARQLAVTADTQALTNLATVQEAG